jgi:8-oxo-dGTP pyrophosphatase MutT (NUDIX family)
MSAGGVVYRRRGGRIEVVLVTRRAERLWALPKGTPEPGEGVEETALREVSEETGLQVSLATMGSNSTDAQIGSIRYTYRDPVHGAAVDKVVHHYLMEPCGGDLADHDDEYDVAAWYDVHEAERHLTYPNERDILRRALELIRGTLDGDSGGVPS